MNIKSIKNRIKAFRNGPAWNTFLGVFWALVLVRTVEILLPVF